MNIDLAEKLKSLRKEKNVTQEKLADYLSVSFQAVSKWENGNACPDISLLPDIARYFGITVDELLQVKKLDEKLLFDEYLKKAWELHRNGEPDDFEIWLEAYKKMPNNIEVKEMLMSTYYDIDKVKYKDEIIDLATEICAADVSNYYKGQAIQQAAITYSVNGNKEIALKWSDKSFQLMHCQEVIRSQVEDGKAMIGDVVFFTYWSVIMLCYMAFRIDQSDNIPGGVKYKQGVFKAVVEIFEALFKNDDMSFEDIMKPVNLHIGIAMMETELGNDEKEIQKHLRRAFELVKKSTHIQGHTLTIPLLENWQISGTPENGTQWVNVMKSQLSDKCFNGHRNAKWFNDITEELDRLLTK